jgi:hypothetical protein
MKLPDLRLDDIARFVVHCAPEVYFELLSPVNPPSEVTWETWSPDSVDVWSCAQARTSIRRLDTQLAPARWLPDLGYVCITIDVHELWVSELQSAARMAPVSRASTCIAHLTLQAFPKPPLGDIAITATELRMRQAPRLITSSQEAAHSRTEGTASRSSSRGRARNGVLRFERSSALFELDPNDPQFAHPRCWPLVCLSPNVSADQILQRYDRLASLQQEHDAAFPDVHLLLGYVGRARFPKDRRFDLLEEYAVNEAAAQSALQLGHMTERERNQLWLDAEQRQRRLHEERIKAAEEKARSEGERKGRAEGERKGLLDAAPLLLASVLSPEELEAQMSKIAKLKTAKAIRQRLEQLLRS